MSTVEWLIHDDSPQERDYKRTYARDLKAGDVISWSDAVTPETFTRWYRVFDVFSLPARVKVDLQAIEPKIGARFMTVQDGFTHVWVRA